MAHRNQNVNSTSTSRPWGNEHDNREDGEFLSDAREVLNEVYRIFRSRAGYGEPADHHGAAAAIRSVLDGFMVTPAEHCMAHLIDKIVRESTEHNEDNLLDAIGYLVIMLHHHRRAAREADNANANGVVK